MSTFAAAELCATPRIECARWSKPARWVSFLVTLHTAPRFEYTLEIP